MKTLNEMKPGEVAMVKRVHGEGSLRRRILDMGIIRGTQLEMVKKAPLGDLSLRQTEAALVEVE